MVGCWCMSGSQCTPVGSKMTKRWYMVVPMVMVLAADSATYNGRRHCSAGRSACRGTMSADRLSEQYLNATWSYLPCRPQALLGGPSRRNLSFVPHVLAAVVLQKHSMTHPQYQPPTSGPHGPCRCQRTPPHSGRHQGRLRLCHCRWLHH
jgi:hypothetical protein